MTTNAHAGGRRAVKAVIPAAGLATRFLPATKAVPKELLPVVDRPVLQYIVEEAAAAGITDVLLVTGRGKTSMVDHFDRRPDVEARLEEKGDLERLAAVRRTSELADIYTCRQGEPLGLGHAVGTAASHVGDNAFAVLLGDEFVDEDSPLLPSMLDLQARTGGIVLALLEVKPEETSRYGIASVQPSDLGGDDIVEVTGLVEKPSPEEAPSNLAVLGRYILPADDLRRDPGHQAGQRRRDPADRRDGRAAGRRDAGARHHLPRPPLRHRHAAGLPAGRGRDRQPSARTWAPSSCSG